MKVMFTEYISFRPAETQKVDAVFRSLHFERIELKDEFEGTPDTAYRVLENEIARVNLEIEDLDKQAGEMLAGPRSAA